MSEWREKDVNADTDSEGETEINSEIQLSQASQATEPALSFNFSTDLDAIEIDELDELVDEQDREQEQWPPLTPIKPSASAATSMPLATLAMVAAAASPASTNLKSALSNGQGDGLDDHERLDNNAETIPEVTDNIPKSPVDTPMDASVDDSIQVDSVGPGDGHHEQEKDDTSAKGDNHNSRTNSPSHSHSRSRSHFHSNSPSSSKNPDTTTNDINNAQSATDNQDIPQVVPPPQATTGAGATSGWCDPPDRDNTPTPKPLQSSQSAQGETTNSWGASEATGSGTSTSRAKKTVGWGDTGDANTSTNTASTTEPSVANDWGSSGNTGGSSSSNSGGQPKPVSNKKTSTWGDTGNTVDGDSSGSSWGWGPSNSNSSNNTAKTSNSNAGSGWGDSANTTANVGSVNNSNGSSVNTGTSGGWGESTASSSGPNGSGSWGSWGDSSGFSSNPGRSGSGDRGSWGDTGGSGGNSSSHTKSQGRERGNVTGTNNAALGKGPGSGWGRGAGFTSGFGHGFGADADPAAPGLLPPMGRGRSAPLRDGGRGRRGKSSDGPYAGAAREHRRQKASGSFDSQDGGWDSEFGSGSGGGGWDDTAAANTFESMPTSAPQKNTNITFGLNPTPSAHINHAYTPDLHFSVITRDMSSFVTQIVTKLEKIREFQFMETNAKQELEAAGKRYQSKKKELRAYLELEDDKAQKVKLLQTLDDFREEEARRYNSLLGSAHVAKVASKDAIESGLKTMAQIINEEIQMGVLNTLRLIGTGTNSGTAGAPVDVSSVLGEMLKVATPQIVKKFLNDVDEQCQARVKTLVNTIKAKDAEIAKLTTRLSEFEARMFNLEQMLIRVEAAKILQPVQTQNKEIQVEIQDEPPQFQSQIQYEEIEEKPIISGNGIDAPIEISDDEMEA